MYSDTRVHRAQAADTKNVFLELDKSEEKHYAALVTTAKQAAAPRAEEAREAWISDRVARGLAVYRERKKASGEPEDAEAEKQVEKQLRLDARQAVEGCVLYRDFEIMLDDGALVTVAEILANPRLYHERRCTDPLEPEYHGDRRIAWIGCNDTTGYIHSHAHGGRRFRLSDRSDTVRIVPGERSRAVLHLLRIARDTGQYYRQGNEIVRVLPDGSLSRLDEPGALWAADNLARFAVWNEKKEAWSAIDCPRALAQGLLAARGEWGLPELRGVVNHPLLDLPSGRLIEKDGYDAETKLLFRLDRVWPSIPLRPDDATAFEALNTLFRAFQEFPFISPSARGAALSTILSAIERPVLPTVPATLVIAPSAGTGKTLACLAFAACAGQHPALVPEIEGREKDRNEELRKRLVALGRGGHRIILLDNLVGQFSSGALCAWITDAGEGDYQDRVLGASEMVPINTRSLLLLNGNNVTLRGDLCRRAIVVSLDSGVETPWTRTFSFSPGSAVRENWQAIVVAALTFLRAALQNEPAPEPRTGSFEVWSDTVRRGVCYAARLSAGWFADPEKTITENYSTDPETEKLLLLLRVIEERKSDDTWTVADIVREANSDAAWRAQGLNGSLLEALEDIAGDNTGINRRRLGRWIEKNSGRVIDGLRLERAGRSRSGVVLWKVKKN